MTRGSVLAVAAMLGALGAGCSKKVPECNALIKQLNETSTVMQQQTGSLGTDSKSIKENLDKLASTTKTETEKLAKVELTLPELQGFSKSYQSLLGEIMKASSSLAEATGNSMSIEESVTKNRSEWLKASSDLRVACIKARKECQKLGDKVSNPPLVTGLNPEMDAKKLDEYKQSIASVEVKNADVKAAVETIKTNIDTFASTMRKYAEVKQATEAARKGMADAAGKEPALVKNINDFCQAS